MARVWQAEIKGRLFQAGVILEDINLLGFQNWREQLSYAAGRRPSVSAKEVFCSLMTDEEISDWRGLESKSTNYGKFALPTFSLIIIIQESSKVLANIHGVLTKNMEACLKQMFL